MMPIAACFCRFASSTSSASPPNQRRQIREQRALRPRCTCLQMLARRLGFAGGAGGRGRIVRAGLFFVSSRTEEIGEARVVCDRAYGAQGGATRAAALCANLGVFAEVELAEGGIVDQAGELSLQLGATSAWARKRGLSCVDGDGRHFLVGDPQRG